MDLQGKTVQAIPLVIFSSYILITTAGISCNVTHFDKSSFSLRLFLFIATPSLLCFAFLKQYCHGSKSPRQPKFQFTGSNINLVKYMLNVSIFTRHLLKKLNHSTIPMNGWLHCFSGASGSSCHIPCIAHVSSLTDLLSYEEINPVALRTFLSSVGSYLGQVLRIFI